VVGWCSWGKSVLEAITTYPEIEIIAYNLFLGKRKLNEALEQNIAIHVL
jgi:hypothetical protein